jgi:hypothetical protein
MVSGLGDVSSISLSSVMMLGFGNECKLDFIPSPSPAGSHFVQSMVGWLSGGLAAIVRECPIGIKLILNLA